MSCQNLQKAEKDKPEKYGKCQGDECCPGKTGHAGTGCTGGKDADEELINGPCHSPGKSAGGEGLHEDIHPVDPDLRLLQKHDEVVRDYIEVTDDGADGRALDVDGGHAAQREVTDDLERGTDSQRFQRDIGTADGLQHVGDRGRDGQQ